MPIYSHGAGPCDRHHHLHSSIGIGPRGHSVTVGVVDGDPYGYYRLQFRDEETGEVISTTPNLDPGSRIYVCDKEFVGTPDAYTASASEFTTEQLGAARDIRVGDIVLFHGTDDDGVAEFGIGVATSVSPNGVVTFDSHIRVGPGVMKETVLSYVDDTVATLGAALDAHIADVKREQDEYLARKAKENDDRISTFARRGVYFGLTDDGHFCAYIPDNWEDIEFDTGTNYGEFDYGRLILRYDVDGSGVIDNTGRYDDITPGELEDRIARIEQTLYTRLGIDTTGNSGSSGGIGGIGGLHTEIDYPGQGD